MLQQRQKVLAKARVNAIAPGVVDTKGRALAALWAATLRRKRLRARRLDASDNLTTSSAS